MSRAEFSKSTKLQAWDRCKGRCECGCGLTIIGTPEYDHIVPAAIGGTNALDNCRVLMKKHHRDKTDKDVPEIAKSQRIYEKRIGARTKRAWPKARDPWGKGRHA